MENRVIAILTIIIFIFGLLWLTIYLRNKYKKDFLCVDSFKKRAIDINNSDGLEKLMDEADLILLSKDRKYILNSHKQEVNQFYSYCQGKIHAFILK